MRKILSGRGVKRGDGVGSVDIETGNCTAQTRTQVAFMEHGALHAAGRDAFFEYGFQNIGGDEHFCFDRFAPAVEHEQPPAEVTGHVEPAPGRRARASMDVAASHRAATTTRHRDSDRGAGK